MQIQVTKNSVLHVAAMRRIPVAVTAQVDVGLLSAKQKKTIVLALKRGFHTAMAGDTAKLYGMFAAAYNLPHMLIRKERATRYNTSPAYFLRLINPQGQDWTKLQEFLHADRLTAKMADIKVPDWDKGTMSAYGSHMTGNLYALKDFNALAEPVQAAFTDNIKDKINEAVALVESGQVVTFTHK